MIIQKQNTDRRSIERHEISLELLALDLDSCTRCVGTFNNIETAIGQVKNVLDATETTVNVHKILIDSEAKAETHRFVSSPTIRINGRDIVFETLESECDSCTDLCGCEGSVSCRVWEYQGKEYTEAPVGLIIESVMHAIFSTEKKEEQKSGGYEGVPGNLKLFFAGTKEVSGEEVTACCSANEQETCCEPAEKEACCQSSEPGTCGCS